MLRHALLCSLLFATPALAEVCPFYIGTFPGPSGGKGIYLDSIDTATGKLGTLSLAVAAPNPGFLALSPDKKFIFATGNNVVVSFAIQSDGTLKAINQQPSGGAGTTHVNVDQRGGCVFVANYTAGNIASFPVDGQGSIGPMASVETFTGSGPNPDRQKHSFAHSVYVDPTNHFVYSCDLGSDTVWIFKLDPGTAKLTPATPPFAKVPPGSGPRHLTFAQDGKIVYVINEMGLTVSVFARDAVTGALTPLQTVPVLQAGTPTTVPSSQPGVPAKSFTASEVWVHPSGKWLYTATRFIDVISVFDIAPDGRLTLKQNVPSVAKTPRDFALDPSGHWLLAAGMDDNRIVVLKIDQATGELLPTDQVVSVGTPVCIQFDPAK